MVEDYDNGRIETEADDYNPEDDFDIDVKMNFSDNEDGLLE